MEYLLLNKCSFSLKGLREGQCPRRPWGRALKQGRGGAERWAEGVLCRGRRGDLQQFRESGLSAGAGDSYFLVPGSINLGQIGGVPGCICDG